MGLHQGSTFTRTCRERAGSGTLERKEGHAAQLQADGAAQALGERALRTGLGAVSRTASSPDRYGGSTRQAEAVYAGAVQLMYD